MRTHSAIVSSLSIVALSAASAQVSIAPRAGSIRMPVFASAMSSPRAVIGVTTSTSTGSRDTLGLLVSTVSRNGPAEKAGIEEGNRIASINGVSLKLANADVGDPDMESLMSRRLIRELDKVKPGDEVDLRVYGNGQTRSIKIKTADPESLYSTRTVSRRYDDERPTLGIGIGSTGSKRDTLGVFVMSVEDGGPAVKAGIEEGQRISAINGVDVRVSHDDAGDDIVSSARVNRFQRELSKIKIGDAVELKVFANGQTRTVKVTSVAWSSLDSHHNAITIIRDGGGMTVRAARPPEDFDFDGAAIEAKVQSAVQKARSATTIHMENLDRALEEMRRGLGGGKIEWFDAPSPDSDQLVPMKAAKPTPAALRKASRTISM